MWGGLRACWGRPPATVRGGGLASAAMGRGGLGGAGWACARADGCMTRLAGNCWLPPTRRAAAGARRCPRAPSLPCLYPPAGFAPGRRYARYRGPYLEHLTVGDVRAPPRPWAEWAGKARGPALPGKPPPPRAWGAPESVDALRERGEENFVHYLVRKGGEGGHGWLRGWCAHRLGAPSSVCARAHIAGPYPDPNPVHSPTTCALQWLQSSWLGEGG